MNTRCICGLLATLFLGTFAVSLQAYTIDGEIHFLGAFTPLDSSGSATTLGDATGLSFDLAVVGAASGDLSATAGRLASITTFQFDPVLDPVPVEPLWTVTGWDGKVYSFTLNTIYIDLHSDNQLNLSGTGVLHADGFEDTLGTWNFQGGGTTMFTFRADDVAVDSGGGGVPVVDGGSAMMLLGISLLGMGYLGKRNRQRMMR